MITKELLEFLLGFPIEHSRKDRIEAFASDILNFIIKRLEQLQDELNRILE